jgi:gas vesicle protein
MMIRLTPAAPAQMKWRFALGAVVVMLLGTPPAAEAQGLVKGVQQGAEAGNKAAGPVGGVLGGAIGGVVGVFNGVLGVGQNGQQAPAANGAKQAGSAKEAKDTKDTKGTKGTKGTKAAAKAGAPAVLTQDGAPTLSAEQIVANSDADIDRIKSELNLTPEQEKNWTAFNSAMHYLGHNGADRLNLRIARAQRDPPDDIIEQMRNEAQFLNDRAVDQRGVADAAEPLFTSLNDKQKAVFIQEMVRLSHERGLD